MLFNETPVVGSPLGFAAADWHLDAARSVGGAALSLAGGWHGGGAHRSRRLRVGPVSPAAHPRLEGQAPPRPHGLSGTGLRLPGGPAGGRCP